jgi:FKBP-type peptidyl-prolyl cis-trans isomerase 2
MRIAQTGDRVQVHYVKRLQDGSTRSSYQRAPVVLTIGVRHPRLPGLGQALVGLVPGVRRTLRVPPEQAYGIADPARIRHWSHRRFPEDAVLLAGSWVLVKNKRGRRRWVRILEVSGTNVLVDTNHRWAGQVMVLEVELLAFQDTAPMAATQGRTPEAGAFPTANRPLPMSSHVVAIAAKAPLPKRAKAVAYDLDQGSMEMLQGALTGWQIEGVNGATPTSLFEEGSPEAADFLIVSAGEGETEPLALCRGLRRQAGRTLIPLLVLVPPGRDALVQAALEAGAHGCLILPARAAGVSNMLARAQQGNQPGRHTLSLDRAQTEDPARDCGGEA